MIRFFTYLMNLYIHLLIIIIIIIIISTVFGITAKGQGFLYIINIITIKSHDQLKTTKTNN